MSLHTDFPPELEQLAFEAAEKVLIEHGIQVKWTAALEELSPADAQHVAFVSLVLAICRMLQVESRSYGIKRPIEAWQTTLDRLWQIIRDERSKTKGGLN